MVRNLQTLLQTSGSSSGGGGGGASGGGHHGVHRDLSRQPSSFKDDHFSLHSLRMNSSVRGFSRANKDIGEVGALLLGGDDVSSQKSDHILAFVFHPVFRWLLRIGAVISLISVDLNTPESFNYFPDLKYITLGVDLFLGTIYLLEAVVKMRIRGLWRHPHSYFRDRWCQFDGIMVLFIWISVIIQILGQQEIVPLYSLWSITRTPRPLIFIRMFRFFLKEQVPKTRFQTIFRRSGKQILNVTLFFLFTMCLYGFIGVQLFGPMECHCVKNTTKFESVSINDLAIPDAKCSMDESFGYQCPPPLVCMHLELPRPVRATFHGFDEFGTSFFTVYQSASQEGWTAIMYQAIDSFPAWVAAAYFMSLIFFLSWLVKNVFIAIIIETFAEIRVQFQQKWGATQIAAAERESTQVLQSVPASSVSAQGNSAPNMVDLGGGGTFSSQKIWRMGKRSDADGRNRGSAPDFLQGICRSPTFNTVMLVFVLADALTAAFISFDYKTPRALHSEMDLFYFIEVGFTILFDIEAILKLWCFGPRQVVRKPGILAEIVLAIGTTLHIIPPFYRTLLFTDFQVFRVGRLIQLSPMLQDFCSKIFGPARKLGSLVVFTLSLLMIVSSISLQLFCSIQNFTKFATFPQAFLAIFQIMTTEGWAKIVEAAPFFEEQSWHLHVELVLVVSSLHLFMTSSFNSMFQILTQKGWVDVMHGTMTATHSLTAVYFVFYHLFINSIVLSIFVAVILDNLEMDEDVKKMKQVKAREQIAEVQKQLPLRLRVYEKFTERPHLVTSLNLPKNFVLPVVRDSFMRHFVGSTSMPLSTLSLVEMSGAKPPILPPPNSASESAGVVNAVANAADNGDMWRTLRHRRTNKVSSEASWTKVVLPLAEQRRAVVSEFVREYTSRPALVGFIPTSHTANVGPSSGGGMGRGVSVGRHLSVNYGQYNRHWHQNSDFARGGDDGHSTLRALGGYALQGATPPLSGTGGASELLMLNQQALEMRCQQEEELRENHPFFDSPLFVIGRDSAFRNFMVAIVTSRYETGATQIGDRRAATTFMRRNFSWLGHFPYFDWMMIVVTVSSCLAMGFETPTHRPTSVWSLALCEYVFVGATTVELFLRIVADGLLFTPNAVLKDFGGCLNVFIYIVSVIFVAWMPEGVEPQSAAQWLLVLRCLRPLKIFTLVPAMRKVVYELCRGYREILMVSVLLIVLMFVFAVYGVQLYGGRLARCNDIRVLNQSDCHGMFLRRLAVTKMLVSTEGVVQPAILVPRVWANPRNFDFDNIGHAMLAMFEMLSLEGWVEIRDVIMKQIGPVHVAYVLVFVFIGCMIGLTLFVGVVISNYSQNKGTALLTVDQRRWLDLRGRIKLTRPLHVPPRPDRSPFRAALYDIVVHRRWFRRCEVALVITNSILLIVPWTVDDQEYFTATVILSSFAVIYVLIFGVIVILKSLAFTFRGYLESRQNLIDFLLTIAGIVWTVLHAAQVAHPPMRYFAYKLGFGVILFRFITITGKHAALTMLMQTVFVSMYKSFPLIATMFILLLAYAFAGVNLFGSVKFGESLGRQANFQTAVSAILLLFRAVTGEDWNRIMHDCMIEPPACQRDGGLNFWQSDCGNSQAAVFYFCSFYVLITYIILNLLVAIILENFSLFYSNDEDALLSYGDIHMFQLTWDMLDTNRKGEITLSQLKLLLNLLRGRIQVELDRQRLKIKHMLQEMERLRGGLNVSFHEVLTMLSYRSVDIRKSLQVEELVEREELERLIEEEVAKSTIRAWLDKCIRRIKKQKQAASILQSLRQTNAAPMPEPLFTVTEAAPTAEDLTAAFELDRLKNRDRKNVLKEDLQFQTASNFPEMEPLLGEREVSEKGGDKVPRGDAGGPGSPSSGRKSGLAIERMTSLPIPYHRRLTSSSIETSAPPAVSTVPVNRLESASMRGRLQLNLAGTASLGPLGRKLSISAAAQSTLPTSNSGVLPSVPPTSSSISGGPTPLNPLATIQQRLASVASSTESESQQDQNAEQISAWWSDEVRKVYNHRILTEAGHSSASETSDEDEEEFVSNVPYL